MGIAPSLLKKAANCECAVCQILVSSSHYNPDVLNAPWKLNETVQGEERTDSPEVNDAPDQASLEGPESIRSKSRAVARRDKPR